MTGQLIVFEGGEAAGKTTVMHNFYNVLYQREQEPPFTLMTGEPDRNYVAGTFIRDVLRGESVASPYLLALSFAANRADHCARFIKPQMDAGVTVLCDRYIMSSLVYQGIEGVARSEIMRLNREIIRPTMTFFLDVNKVTARERLKIRGGVPERFDERFDDIHEGYLFEISMACQNGHNINIIDANQDEQAVCDQITNTYDIFMHNK